MLTVPRRARATLALALALAAAFTAAAAATAEPAAQAASAPVRTPYPAIDPAFSRPDTRRVPGRETLRSYLATRESSLQLNNFCFVQQSLDPGPGDEQGESLLWMIWREGATIQRINVVRHGQSYRPDPALDPVTEGQALAYATGRINLKTGVVPTDEDVGTSTFLVGRPWVNHMFAQCKRVGTSVRMPAFRAVPTR
ncbi:hypothetical protein M4R22_10140 [Acidovorax sp. GBBC 3334]|uniref:hypothetical protein n=1 Tax=Acidovorax sp. GBBC 3334 TaxID=2940496 RepID=UPI002304AE6C|nr:hypothetical protein [Acidovorax sp. GBBC 3334]MDA8455123.1 hypothetical protein [Acidovorax sp. GBBC 3334]